MIQTSNIYIISLLDFTCSDFIRKNVIIRNPYQIENRDFLYINICLFVCLFVNFK